jgi:hypothetical protein
MWLAVALVAGGCGSGDDSGTDDPNAAAVVTTTTPVPSTVAGTTVPPTNLTLRATDLRLVISEETNRGVRVLLPAGVASASVTLPDLPSPNRAISVCQTQDLTAVMSGAACRTPTGSEAVTVTLGTAARGVEIIHVATPTTGPASNTFTLKEVQISYAASSREVDVRLPQIDAGDSAGRPTFALTPPAADGAYRATFRWQVIQSFGGTPSQGQLEVLRSGTVVDQSQGSPEVRINGTAPPPRSDLAIRAQNVGTSLLVNPALSMLLP